MTYPKLINFVNKISKGTERGLIEWEDTESPDEFQASFSDYSVRVGVRGGHSGFGDEYYLSVIDSLGDVIEKISDEDPSEDALRKVLFADLKLTYDVARRRVKGVEQALDSILGDLSDLDNPFR